MDEEAFKALVKRLSDVNKVVASLDPAIRADAFALMEPYVAGSRADGPQRPARGSGGDATPAGTRAARKSAPRRPKRAKQTAVVPTDEEEEALVEQHLSDDDSTNALLALAILYMRHGRGLFDLGHLKGVAQQFNLNVPRRMDKFFLAAKRGDDKRHVLRKQEDGWKVTPSGGDWLNETYGVKMGRDPLPADE